VVVIPFRHTCLCGARRQASSSGTMVWKNTFRKSPPGRRPYGLEAMRIGSTQRGVFDSPIMSGTSSAKITPEDLWHAEGEMAVGDGLEDLLTKPFTKFYT